MIKTTTQKYHIQELCIFQVGSNPWHQKDEEDEHVRACVCNAWEFSFTLQVF